MPIGAGAAPTTPTVLGCVMSVMSRTTNWLLPRRVTSARQRGDDPQRVGAVGLETGVAEALANGDGRAVDVTETVAGPLADPQPAPRTAAAATIQIQRRTVGVTQRQ